MRPVQPGLAGAERLWGVDAARGLAVAMMLLSNLLFDLALFLGCGWCYQGFWLLFARATAGLFILLAGVSLALSYSRVKDQPPRRIWRKYLARGGRIFLYGMALTGITLALVPQGPILFGILHLIGLSIVLGVPFLGRPVAGGAAGILILLVGLLLTGPGNPWLLWLVPWAGFFSVDYTPLLPWFGIFLIGMSFGSFLRPAGAGERSPGSLRPLTALGRRSLLIYFAHQPVFLGLISLWLGRIPLG